MKIDRRAYQNKTDYWEIIGNIVNEPELLDRYNIVPEDFVDPFHRYIFENIQEMYENGYKNLSSVNISEYMEQNHAAMYERYKKFNGDGYINDCVKVCTKENFSFYFEDLKKWSLLRKFIDAGIDVTDFYDSNEVDADLIEKHNALFNKCSPRDITNYFLNKITEASDGVKITLNKLPIFDPLELPDSDEEEDVLIEGMMYNNTLNSIVGQSKAGKSFFAYQMCYCVQNGIPFLGHETQKADVLYIDFELRTKSIRDRCLKVKDFYDVDDTQNFKIMSLSKTWGTNEVDLDSIIQTIRSYKSLNPNLKLVCFDCYYRFAEGEENKAEDVMRTLSKIKPLTGDMAVVYVHHTNKMGIGSNAINAASGSGVHGRIVDQTYVLSAKKDGIEVENTGRDWYNDKMVCRRDETGYFILEDAEMQAQREQEERHKVDGKITKETLKKKYPEICEYIDLNTDDDYGCALTKLIKSFPNETVKSLKEKGFKYTGKNKRSDSIPCGRIIYP